MTLFRCRRYKCKNDLLPKLQGSRVLLNSFYPTLLYLFHILVTQIKHQRTYQLYITIRATYHISNLFYIIHYYRDCRPFNTHGVHYTLHLP
ncbi:hypothetical protein F4813DRAFT_368014 [Daldinia decipiens]|uniref:uncharacterized protein n=1 Tax=Daldinia decipiens TaxID=326647 RepID=UPI0020C4B6A0|nr:uncharacterized protein F4813DRAFT_368014 [Daldinia decipiens]KAI1655187.1 hypothetical protein F4813DRAFT_368014 [Daldinia decipiens]